VTTKCSHLDVHRFEIQETRLTIERAAMPATWASPLPFGLGQAKPHHFAGMARALLDNRDQLPLAWRILRDGVCDGCALGTSGLHDWTMDSIHLCMTRLELLRLNTMKALDPRRLADAEPLAGRSSAELRALGRLGVPLLRRRGEPGFHEVSWDAALGLVAERLRAVPPLRTAFYLTSRGIPNETYYVCQKAARLLGTPHVDNAARLCHAASTVALKRALGHGASTGSYRDWIGADLIVFFGSNAPNAQPVTAKYLYYAKQRGAEVAVVNPLREPGLERYWVPSVPRSALFGTRLCDHWFDVDTGGDLAFANGVLKALVERPDGVDRGFIGASTAGFAELEAALAEQDWEMLERTSGTRRAEMLRFAELLRRRPDAIFVWSMGITQHAHGVDTVQAILNLGIARGLTGQRHRGLMPIRGHSGVQGGAEVGAVPVGDRATLERWARVWGFEPPRAAGLSAVDQVEASARGEIDLWWLIGGNFLETVPGEDASRAALTRPGLRIHHDIVLNRAMLEPPSNAVLLLPATTRYEIPGGVTETTTERRIVFSPEIPGRRIREARPEWEVLCEAVRRAFPDRGVLLRFRDTAEIRREIASAVPLYAGIESLARKGDQVQWGGPTLYEAGNFATPDGKARFFAVRPPDRGRAGAAGAMGDGASLLLSTRRGSQFNSMVWRDRDPLTGAERDELLISEEDALRFGLVERERVAVRSEWGTLELSVRLAPIKPGNAEVHWPEGMALLPRARLDPHSREPDYNARVVIEKRGRKDAGLEAEP
jgi:molybdopterin-dependent oxidoreductase alpha subunit